MLSAHAVTHPQFFQAWQSPDSADPVLSREPSSDYIQLPVVSDYAALVRDEAFSAIQAQFLGDIQKLRQLAPNFVNYQYDDAIRTFYNKIQSPSYDSTAHLLPIYRETRYHIHELVSVLENHQHACTDQSDYIAVRLHDCLTDIEKCLAGVHSRFASSLINLEAGLKGLDGKMFQVRQELYQRCIASFMFQQQRQALVIIPSGSEVHWSNALHNIYCQAIGLPPIVDPAAPAVLSDRLVDRFLAMAELSVSACSILRELSAKWSDQLSSTLNDLGIAAWETDVIEPSQMTSEKTDAFDGKLFQPINHLLKTAGKQPLNLWSLIEENDDHSYRLDRHREKLLARLSNHFCESAVQVFATIPGAVRGAGVCIGTIGELFFWGFADDTALCAGQPCTFNTDNHISITLPHLITLDFTTWPKNTSHALLTQAMEQTDDPEDIASFFLNPAINAQLSKTPAPIIQALSNQLVSKLVRNPGDFQKRLCQCVGDQLAQQQTITPQTLHWLMDTPILGPVLQALQGKPGLASVTGQLETWQISDFSQDNVKTLLTDGDCKRLFSQAYKLNQPQILARLLLSGRCGQSIERCRRIGIDLLGFFALAGVLPGVEYLLKFTTLDVNGAGTPRSSVPLSCAAKSGSIECLNALLAVPGIQVNKRRNPDGWTPLHVAARNGHRACVIALLQAGAEVHGKSVAGVTALTLAAGYGHIDCIEALLAAGGCPDNDNVKEEHSAVVPSHRAYVGELLETGSCRINDTDSNGNTPLHGAAISGHSFCVRALLGAPGINVNLANCVGWTPLHYAISYGHTGATEVLLCADGIQVNLITEARSTPLGCAAMHGQASCAAVLLRHPDIQVNLKDRDQMTPLDHAAKYGHAVCLGVLLSAGADQVVNDLSVEGYTPLGKAAEGGSWYCVTELLSVEHVRVNERNSGGCTALHFAAERGHTSCVLALLRAEGIEIGVRNDGGWTPLDCAVKNGHVRCTKLLLSADPSRINNRNPAGNTLLCSAIIEGHYACVMALLGTAGILVNLGNKEGWTPLLCAVVFGRTQCLRSLLWYGKDNIPLNEVTETGWTPLTCAARHGRDECIRLLMDADGVDINQRDLFHRTPLDHAVERNHKRCIQVLLSAGDCLVNDPVPNGLTPLCRAAKEGHDSTIEALLSAKTIQVNKSSPDGMTALHYCAKHGNTCCLILLLGAVGKEVNIKNAAGLFPLDLAIKYGHMDCAHALLEKGGHQADMMTIRAEGGPAGEQQYQTEDA